MWAVDQSSVVLAFKGQGNHVLFAAEEEVSRCQVWAPGCGIFHSVMPNLSVSQEHVTLQSWVLTFGNALSTLVTHRQ